MIMGELGDNLKVDFPRYKGWINACIYEIENSSDICIKMQGIKFLMSVLNDCTYNIELISEGLNNLILSLLKILTESKLFETKNCCVKLFCYFIQHYTQHIALEIYSMISPYLTKYWSMVVPEDLKCISANPSLQLIENISKQDSLFELKRNITKLIVYFISVCLYYIYRKQI